jgi:hypothetical protein
VGVVGEVAFAWRVAQHAVTVVLPRSLCAAATASAEPHKAALLRVANDCALSTAACAAAARYAADAADAAADAAACAAAACAAADDAAAAADAAADKELAWYAEEIVQILIDMGSPGCAFLDLAPLP